jgi:O-antigen/teichoic acid export membrane protein
VNLFRLFKSQEPALSASAERFFQTDHIKADIKVRTARGGAIIAATQIIKQVLSIGSAIILARLLGPEQMGLIAMVTVLTGFIESFNDLGLSAATVQRAEITQHQVSTLFWINVALSALLAVITAVLAPVNAWFYAEPRLTLVTLVLASDFIFTGLTVQHRALLRRQMMFSALALIDIFSTIVSIAVGVAAALSGFGYWSLVLMKLGGIPVEIIGAWSLCRWRPGPPVRNSGVRSMIAFGGNLTGFRLVTYVARNLDNVLIGRFFGAAQLGLYTRAYGLLLLPLRRINEPFAGVAWPALSRLTDAPDRYRQAYIRMVTSLCMLSIPLVAWMMSAADWFILVLLGPEWIAASQIFVWLGVSGLIEPFSSTTSWLFVSQGRTREQFRWSIISTGITVTSILAGLPWGPVGVATAYGLVGLLIRTPLLFWLVGRSGPVATKDLYRDVAPFAVISIAILLSLHGFRVFLASADPLINLLLSVGIAGVVTLLVLLALPRGREALQQVLTLPSLIFKR